MMYNYVADGYALAFLFSCVAAMLITKDNPCYIGSLVLIALSAGIYELPALILQNGDNEILVGGTGTATFTYRERGL